MIIKLKTLKKLLNKKYGKNIGIELYCYNDSLIFGPIEYTVTKQDKKSCLINEYKGYIIKGKIYESTSIVANNL